MMNSTRRMVRIDDTLELFLGQDTTGIVDRKIARALKQGKAVTENGVSRWITNFEVIRSGEYVWDKSGNKVLADKILHTKTANGLTKVKIGSCWITP